METLKVDYHGLFIDFADANNHNAEITWEASGDVEINGTQYHAGDKIPVMSIEYDEPDDNYSLLNKFYSSHALEMSSTDFDALKQAIISHKNASTNLHFNPRLIQVS